MIPNPSPISTKPAFLERHAFHLAIGGFVIVSSFLYGISAGLSNRSSSAHARFATFAGESAPELSRLALPAGVTASPLGRDVLINDHPAEVVSFVSERPAPQLVEKQMEIWRAAGFKTLGKAGPRRGIALAFDEARGERYSFSAWTVPPALRAKVSGGNPTQGFMSVSDSQRSGGKSDGLVPGVPLKPGGKAGAVFSAVDPGGRTYTGAYTNPGSVGENIEHYRAELAAGGWEELAAESGAQAANGIEIGNTIFRRAGEELVLLFTPGAEGADGPSTVVSVTRGPIDIERWRGIE